MSDISKNDAVALLTASARKMKNGAVFVESRRGTHLEWIPLSEAIGLVELSASQELLDNASGHRLSLTRIGIDHYRFQVKEGTS